MPNRPLAQIAPAAAALLAFCGALPAPAGAAAAWEPHPILHMRLIATDTNELYPFATIVVGGTTYRVTEGDVLKGVAIERITPTRVRLSDDRVLVLQSIARRAAGRHGAVALRPHER